jgi:hypothetical protein
MRRELEPLRRYAGLNVHFELSNHPKPPFRYRPIPATRGWMSERPLLADCVEKLGVEVVVLI